MVNIPKMCNYMLERPIGIATSSSSLFFVSCSVEDGTWCWGVFLKTVTGQGQFLGFIVCLTYVTTESYLIGERGKLSHS